MPTLRLFDADSDPLPVETHSLLVSDILSLYLRHAHIEQIHSPTAKAERQRVLAYFAESVGSLRVEDAKAFHLIDWIEANANHWKSVSTRRAKASQIRAAFQWAADTDRILKNPFRTVRYSEAEPRQAMPDETFSLFAKLGNKRFEAALRFLRYTGCRLGEMCEATWESMDLDRGEWTILKHKTRKKTKRPKRVGLVPVTVELVKAQPKIGDFVFTNTKGYQWHPAAMGTCFRWLKRRYGIQTNACLHSLRHSAASAMLNAGGAAKLVAEQLGHADTRMLDQFYYHRDDSHLAAIRQTAELGMPKE